MLFRSLESTSNASPHCIVSRRPVAPGIRGDLPHTVWLHHVWEDRRKQACGCFTFQVPKGQSWWLASLRPCCPAERISSFRRSILPSCQAGSPWTQQAKDLYWHHLMFLQEISLDQTALSLNSNSYLWIPQPSRFGYERWQTILMFIASIKPNNDFKQGYYVREFFLQVSL